jgi:hypothetical protein
VKLSQQPAERLGSVVEQLGSDIVILHPSLDPIVERSPNLAGSVST